MEYFPNRPLIITNLLQMLNKRQFLIKKILYKNVRDFIRDNIMLAKLSRLKNFFRAGINYSNYEKILQNTERKTVGNIPDDLKRSLFALHTENKREAILDVQNVFEETAAVLGKVNIYEKQAIFRMSSTPRAQERQVHCLIKGNPQEQWADSLYKEKTLETVIKAEEVMLNGIKKYFPDVQNVVITPLGSGVFGYGFRCEIFGKNGKKIIGDKVLKVYREQGLCEMLAEKNERWLNIVSDEELLEYTQRSVRMLNKNNLSYQIPMPKSGTKIRKSLQDQHKMANDFAQESQKVHGAAAEANTSEYLRHAAGHKLKPEDGITIPYMFGLGDTKFAVSEFIDKSRKAAKKFEFGRLGVRHGDFEMNPGNNFNGICIDLGGISPLSEDLMSNDTALKFLKRLFQTSPDSRKQVLEQFKTTVSPKEVSQKIISEIEDLLIAV